MGEMTKKGLSIKEEKRKIGAGSDTGSGEGLQKKKMDKERLEWVDKVGQELKEAERGV